MTQKERLANLLDEFWEEHYDCCNTDAMTDHLLSHGVIVPPCKVGDTVWCMHPVFEDVTQAKIEGFYILEESVNKRCTVELKASGGGYGWTINTTFDDFKTSCFKTKGEAEMYLQEVDRSGE